MDGKFDVTITLNIVKDGSKFADYKLEYTGTSYDQMQATQHALTDALLALGDGNQTKKK